MSSAANLFDIKSASLDLLAIVLRSTDLTALQAAIQQRFNSHEPEPFVLDIEQLPAPDSDTLAPVCAMLQQHGLRIAAVRHRDAQYAALAHRLGLPFISGSGGGKSSAESVSAPVAAAPVADSSLPTPTMIIDRPVRAGQQIYAKGGDLVVLEMVSAGAELIADGSIHVYAPLRGRALAGARGNTAARIFVKSMEAELVSIAGVYRTIEQDLPQSIKGKPTQIYLEQERVVMIPLDK
ncbi:septum site-determining protein MinC [Vogesella indigofera]|uniref:Probable septum site-determining protein MinC n=1 Tax=Vogesella indigofera TaxID=45465 RepID=A0A495B1P8_VOGIN|nr:septum site-determining protein MinC [Vogesella indigofera]MDC7699213.1 septum site-determining protein MinC [Vogesella indigofera]RKQ54856.1 septum site-determining protein MinC [Vogesella indigofera]